MSPYRNFYWNIFVKTVPGVLKEQPKKLECYIAQNITKNDTITIYSDASDAQLLFEKISTSKIDDRVGTYIISDRIHRNLGFAKYRSSRSQLPIEGKHIFIDSSTLNDVSAEVSSGQKILLDKVISDFMNENWGLPGSFKKGDSIYFYIFSNEPQDTDFIEVNYLPTIYISTSKAGSGMFGPILRWMASEAGRPHVAIQSMDSMRKNLKMEELDMNISENDTRKYSYPYNWNNLRNREESKLIKYAADLCHWFDFTEVHKVPQLAELEKNIYADIIILTRDPRDMVVSHVLYMAQKNGAELSDRDVSKQITHYIQQELRFLCDEFIYAHSSKRIFTLKYEDFLLNPEIEYLKLLEWLCWSHQISEEDISYQVKINAIKPESFSIGKLFSNQKNTKFRVSDTGTFVRSGTPGDWKKYFTPETKDLFKKHCGIQLIKLGYEEKNDW